MRLAVGADLIEVIQKSSCRLLKMATIKKNEFMITEKIVCPMSWFVPTNYI